MLLVYDGNDQALQTLVNEQNHKYDVLVLRLNQQQHNSCSNNLKLIVMLLAAEVDGLRSLVGKLLTLDKIVVLRNGSVIKDLLNFCVTTCTKLERDILLSNSESMKSTFQRCRSSAIEMRIMLNKFLLDMMQPTPPSSIPRPTCPNADQVYNEVKDSSCCGCCSCVIS